MIFSDLENYKSAKHLYPDTLCKALDYLIYNDVCAMNAGVYQIDGEKIKLQVVETKTKLIEDTLPEVHEKYIDIHCTLVGTERVGVAHKTEELLVSEDSLAEKDILFYKTVPDENFLTLGQGKFLIVFPWDIHRPCIAADVIKDIKKVVIKVSLEALQQKN